MPFEGIKVPESVAQEGGVRRIRIPEGDYLFECQGAKPSPEKTDAGKEYILFEMVSLKGPEGGIGKRLPHFASLSENAAWQLGRPLRAAGIDPTKVVGKELATYAAFVSFAAALDKAMKGKKLGGTVGDNAFNGNVTSQVVSWYPEAEYPDKPTVTAAATSGAGGETLAAEIGDLFGGDGGLQL